MHFGDYLLIHTLIQQCKVKPAEADHAVAGKHEFLGDTGPTIIVAAKDA